MKMLDLTKFFRRLECICKLPPTVQNLGDKQIIVGNFSDLSRRLRFLKQQNAHEQKKSFKKVLITSELTIE